MAGLACMINRVPMVMPARITGAFIPNMAELMLSEFSNNRMKFQQKRTIYPILPQKIKLDGRFTNEL